MDQKVWWVHVGAEWGDREGVWEGWVGAGGVELVPDILSVVPSPVETHTFSQTCTQTRKKDALCPGFVLREYIRNTDWSSSFIPSFTLWESDQSDKRRRHYSTRTKVDARGPGCACIYLSVRVLMVFVIAGVVVLLDEAEVLLSLPLKDAVSSFCVSWEVTLRDGEKTKKKNKTSDATRTEIIFIYSLMCFASYKHHAMVLYLPSSQSLLTRSLT